MLMAFKEGNMSLRFGLNSQGYGLLPLSANRRIALVNAFKEGI